MQGGEILPEERPEEASEVNPHNNYREVVRRLIETNYGDVLEFVDVRPSLQRESRFPRTFSFPGPTLQEREFLNRYHASQKITQEAKERAWQLLKQFLRPEQEEQARENFVIENGELGSWRIPLKRGLAVSFETEDVSRLQEHQHILPEKVQTELTMREAQAQGKEGSKRFSCSLCFSDTAPDAPWHDVALTLILHIRAGNEKVLWERANILSLSSSNNHFILPISYESVQQAHERFSQFLILERSRTGPAYEFREGSTVALERLRHVRTTFENLGPGPVILLDDSIIRSSATAEDTPHESN